ncbi:hypothetical protein [Entomospira culicis]|uniref:Uncharacterized protein n=1 Tax=Entomospira culicis TaxID=2719989 RepID=A0A968GGG5_9SPIO|nr:hypothetical protein [Entomospira culicis]NIZ19839.1 hypothetical protein [Entomospira culicis]NIZ70053.1 hypothetical protein [Entomospira culicis]WDI37158.1 hypothetical protein PVA46_07510 [Entomospira culicis]WDI38787.1 hypothetical protein PVA47_07520 [Entomospira culicis]
MEKKKEVKRLLTARLHDDIYRSLNGVNQKFNLITNPDAYADLVEERLPTVKVVNQKNLEKKVAKVIDTLFPNDKDDDEIPYHNNSVHHIDETWDITNGVFKKYFKEGNFDKWLEKRVKASDSD